MTESTEAERVTSMLHKITSSIDTNLSITIAEVLNIYMSSLKRATGRVTLHPEDAIRILHIINNLQQACGVEAEPGFDFPMPGTPTHGKPLSDPPQSPRPTGLRRGVEMRGHGDGE